jgi:hypothetical protein
VVGPELATLALESKPLNRQDHKIDKIMKTIKYLMLVGLLCTGLSSLANASLNFLGEFTPASNGDPAELALFIEKSGMTDAFICDKTNFDNPFPGPDVTDGDFTFSFGDRNADGNYTVTVTFDLSNSDHVVCGFFVKDGHGNSGNLYTLTGTDQTGGSFLLVVPEGGQLSHVTVFCCPGNGMVPDSGTTAMLLGGALTGLGVARRYLKR